MEHVFKREELPSGKIILRHFGEDGSLIDEQHAYGILDIGIRYEFKAGAKIDEVYFSKQRIVSRRTYAKVRVAYSDMPQADETLGDGWSDLMRMVRMQQKRNKEDAQKRLAESAESRFPRPDSTNWLRVISSEKSYLVIFASHDWKVLSDARELRTGREWLNLFGFHRMQGKGGSVAEGLVVGYEVDGNTEAMLKASQLLLVEVNAFVTNPPEISQWSGSIRPRPKPRKKPPLAWPGVLPPLINFLSGLKEPTVKIFNHHR